MWLFELFFLNSENLICRGTDISKCFRESHGIRDNESRLYWFDGISEIPFLASRLINHWGSWGGVFILQRLVKVMPFTTMNANSSCTYYRNKLTHDVRKQTFEHVNQRRFGSACVFILTISVIRNFYRCIMDRKWHAETKTLTWLRGCADWFESSFGTQIRRYVSRVVV